MKFPTHPSLLRRTAKQQGFPVEGIGASERMIILDAFRISWNAFDCMGPAALKF